MVTVVLTLGYADFHIYYEVERSRKSTDYNSR